MKTLQEIEVLRMFFLLFFSRASNGMGRSYYGFHMCLELLYGLFIDMLAFFKYEEKMGLMEREGMMHRVTEKGREFLNNHPLISHVTEIFDALQSERLLLERGKRFCGSEPYRLLLLVLIHRHNKEQSEEIKEFLDSLPMVFFDELPERLALAVNEGLLAKKTSGHFHLSPEGERYLLSHPLYPHLCAVLDAILLV